MLYMKKECEKVFKDYKMIAVVQNNGSNAEDMMILKHRLHKHGISVKSFPNQVTITVYQHTGAPVTLCRQLPGGPV